MAAKKTYLKLEIEFYTDDITEEELIERIKDVPPIIDVKRLS